MLAGKIDEFFEKLVDHDERVKNEMRLMVNQVRWDFLKQGREIGFAEAVEEYLTRQDDKD